MESILTPKQARRLPKNILRLIFTYLEASQISKKCLYALNKSIYTDLDFVGSLFSQVLMSKLGVINDY